MYVCMYTRREVGGKFSTTNQGRTSVIDVERISHRIGFNSSPNGLETYEVILIVGILRS